MSGLAETLAALAPVQSALGWVVTVTVPVAVLLYARRDKHTDASKKDEETAYTRLLAELGRCKSDKAEAERDRDAAETRAAAADLRAEAADEKFRAIQAELDERNSELREMDLLPVRRAFDYIRRSRERDRRDWLEKTGKAE